MARDLAAPGGRPAGGWWEWHAGKAALEFLWRGGQLAVARRQGFQKVYDLPERVIPGAAAARGARHDDFVDWACRSALERLGFASPGEIARFWGLLTPAEATAWAPANLGKAAVPARLEGADGSARRLLARPDLPDLLRACRRRRPACARSTRSTRCCATATASPACSASTTASRCSCRRRSGAGATTSSRCSRASAWSAGST